MQGKRSLPRRLLTVDLPMLLILGFTLGPYLWMMLTSLTPESLLFTHGPSLANVDFSNYVRLFSKIGFLSNLIDSLIIASGAVLVGLTLSVTAAYAFSRFRFPGKRMLMVQFLIINMARQDVAGQVGQQVNAQAEVG